MDFFCLKRYLTMILLHRNIFRPTRQGLLVENKIIPKDNVHTELINYYTQ